MHLSQDFIATKTCPTVVMSF